MRHANDHATSKDLHPEWPQLASRAETFPWGRRRLAWSRGCPSGDPFWHHQRTTCGQSGGPPLTTARNDNSCRPTETDGAESTLDGDSALHRWKGGAWSCWQSANRRISALQPMDADGEQPTTMQSPKIWIRVTRLTRLIPRQPDLQQQPYSTPLHVPGS